MLCMSTLLRQVISIPNVFNAIYMSKQLIHSLHNMHTCNGMHVNAVDTIELQS